MKKYFDKLISQIKEAIEIETIKNDDFLQTKINNINYNLKNTILYDYLNSKINITKNKFILSDSLDENVYRNVINYFHKENIYLYYDVEITHNTNEDTKKILFFSKILEILLTYFINNPDKSLLISSRYKSYLLNLQELYRCKVYSDLGLKEVPSYKSWNYEKQEMLTIGSKPIKKHIDFLSSELSNYTFITNYIEDKTIKILNSYYTRWWENYRKYIDDNFSILKDKLNYYNGVNITLNISKYVEIQNKNFSNSSLALSVGLSNNNYKNANIIINKEISDITFLNELYDNETDVTVTLAFDENILENDFQKMIESNINISINEEILNYYKRILSYENYKYFCKEILKSLDYRVDVNNKIISKYNFITEKNEVFKLEFSQSASKEIVKDLGKRRSKETNLLILNKDILNNSIKKKYEKEKIYIKDIDDIFKIAKSEIVFKNNKYLLKNVIYPHIEKEISSIDKLEKLTISEKLINDIKNCPLGKEGWKQFEEICLNIFKYVFKDSFSNLLIKEQARDELGTDIKDFLVSNNGKHEFWKTIKQIYNCNNIVMECKNYKKEIGINELRQVSDYLEEKIFGQFGIIFTRKGLDNGGMNKQIKYLKNQTKKMILVLNENDIIELIERKSMNKNPEETFEYLKFDLEAKV